MNGININIGYFNDLLAVQSVRIFYVYEKHQSIKKYVFHHFSLRNKLNLV